ncbi:MAG: DNA polymerase IV, partial [Chitinophagia bacterium]|nr:DNA polymerase IV [Chitinophagia bacterium]
LVRDFGKVGRFYYRIVRGIDNRKVEPYRETKSLGAEDTFAHDLTTRQEMHDALARIAVIVHERLLKAKLSGRTLTLKIKYHDFRQITRNKSWLAPMGDLHTITVSAQQLLEATGIDGKRVRLLGITLSNFGDPPAKKKKGGNPDQLELF